LINFEFNIWVDADSCPNKIREYLINQSQIKKINVNFVANQAINCLNTSDSVKMIIAEKTKDGADNYIYDNVKNNDIVITRDILFAERLVKKNIAVMNDRGVLFTKYNIQDRLLERSFSLNLSEIGLGGGKKSYYSDKEFKKFCTCFESQLQNSIMKETYHIT